MIKHTGGCHCGRVRFEVLAPARIRVSECNGREWEKQYPAGRGEFRDV